MYYITRRYTFEAAHYLPNHDGKCSRPHGHSYKVEVELGGAELYPEGAKEGMLMDFADVDELIRPTIDAMDHRTLTNSWAREPRYQNYPPNELFFIEGPTTAENIAYYLSRAIRSALASNPSHRIDMVSRVTVWETERNSATYR